MAGEKLIRRALEAIRQPAAAPREGIRAYHASPHDFEAFRPSEFRGASFFASTPERARSGAGAGANEMVMETSTVLPPAKMRTYEVEIDPTKIQGLHLTPAEQEWIRSAPSRIVGDEALEQAMKGRPNPYIDWESIYSPNKIEDRLYEYVKKDELPSISYDDAIRTGRDVYGRQHSHYGAGADEKAAARRVLDQGMGGYLVNDEAGLSIAVADPSIVQILKKYGLPVMTAGAGAASMADQPGAAMEAGDMERDGFDRGGTVARALRTVRQMMERSQDLPAEQRMMVVHKTRLPALEQYERLGGLPVPSTAVVKTGEPLTNFGDVTLIGNPEILAKPSERNPIFASDVYSPRMPDIQGDKKKFFETYNRYGEPTRHSVTLGSLVRNMRGNVRGGENFGATEGAVRAQITPQFRSVAELDAARGRLSQAAYDEALAAMRGRGDELFARIGELSRNPRDMDFYGDMEGVARIMRQYGNQSAEPLAAYMTKRYNVGNDEMSDVVRYVRDLRDMPAPYFEGKPQRAVPFTDFSGALIPEGRTARDTADLLNRQGVRNIEFYSPKQDLGGGEAERALSDALIERFPGQQFAEGGEVREGYDKGGPVRRAIDAARRIMGYTDPPTKKIEDWQWRPLSEVDKELGLREIPPHVQQFGDYMREMVDRGRRGEISDRDLIKAYTTTRASIQRRAANTDAVREASGLPLFGAEKKIRPEGAWSEWLMSPAGQKYLDRAVKGEMSEDTVESALSVMRKFGLAPTQIEAMDWAAKNLPGRSQAASDLVYRAGQMDSPVSEWREFTSDVKGVGPAKSGFVASLLGRGDLPTLDARQVILNTGLPTDASQSFMGRSFRGQKSFGAQEGVDRLAARQEALGLEAPSKYDPFYQHLAHHAIWDKASNEKTTHADIINAMRNAGIVLGLPAAGAAVMPEDQPVERASGGRLLEDEYPTHYLPNVGRQVMADGGVPAASEKYEAMPGFIPRWLGLSGRSQPKADIQQYENRMRAIAQQPEDIRSMTHAPSKPLRPVEIEGGLIGKRTLGKVPYDVAGPLSGTAQAAYSLKTAPLYFTPAAPLAAAVDFGEAAIDTAKAAREGDYLGAGITGALSVAMPGYAYRRPIGDVVGRALNFVRNNPGAVGAGVAGAAVMTPEEAEASKLNLVRRGLEAARGIRAYHGSPHDFERFDLSKIGTGEGAQAYGHGLYFAENEGVARGYRDTLSDPKRKRINPNSMDPQDIAIAFYRNLGDQAGAAHAERMSKSDPANAASYLKAAEIIRGGNPYANAPKGHMYEVNINARPEQFLDWDRPLREQPEILERLRDYGGSYRSQIDRLKAERDALAAQAPRPASTGDDFADLFSGGDWDGWARLSNLNQRISAAENEARRAAQRGALFSENLNQDFLVSTLGRNLARGKTSPDAQSLLGVVDDKEISSTLRNIGIPGIRYLDAGSRGAGEGSRNYVVFDDKLIDILRKYAKGGVAKELGSSPREPVKS